MNHGITEIEPPDLSDTEMAVADPGISVGGEILGCYAHFWLF